MKIPTEEFEKGVELCFNNVTSLLEDANLLLNKGSNGHALFLLFLRLKKLVRRLCTHVEESRFGKVQNYIVM